MTPLILLTLLGFGVALTAATASSDDTEDTDEIVEPTPPEPILPEEPQEPETFDIAGLNTEGFSQQYFELSDSTVINGTDAADFIQANPEDGTSYNGADGNDLLRGSAEADRFNGGSGDDTIVAGAGNDGALGSRGDDLIFLGDGDDEVTGFSFNEIGDDTIVGGAGSDTIFDDVGSNQLFGGEGDDMISALDADQLPAPFQPFPVPEEGQRTPDFVDGGTGDDTILAQDGDTVIGGDGADTIRLNRSLGIENAPVIIEDFDTQEDVLTVNFRGTSGVLIATGGPLEFVADEAAGGVTVLLRNGPIAFLRGLQASDIANIVVAEYDPLDQL